jgi:hypothetical protein
MTRISMSSVSAGFSGLHSFLRVVGDDKDQNARTYCRIAAWPVYTEESWLPNKSPAGNSYRKLGELTMELHEILR